MRRRDALALLASATTSGCLDALPFDAPAAGPAPDISYELSITDQDDLAREIPLALDVEVVEPAATDEHPARLRVTAENTLDEPLEVQTGVQPVFAGFTDWGDPPGLMLVPPDWDLEPVDAGCWRTTERVRRNDVIGTRTYEPGGVRTAERTVWAAPDRESGCVPAGEYRFEHGYAFGRDGEADREFRWGFDAAVERP